MIGPPTGAILTAAQTRDAEAAAIEAGATIASLMERAGAAVAETALRMAAGRPVLILVGPGNNGGDGYVAARLLAEQGVAVRIAALGEPKSDGAIAAARRWSGDVETLSPETRPAALIVDGLFGTGLARPLDDALTAIVTRLVGAAQHSLAIDLPSGLASDDGRCLGDVARFDVTLALGAIKPAHLLLPGAAHCGRVLLADIGLSAAGDVSVLERPQLVAPAPDAHKYSRGMVAVVGGAMAGAALLAAEAAMHGGAGYVALLGGKSPGGPHALVRRRCDAETLSDERIGAVVIGCGLGRDETARERLSLALAADQPIVIDGDALTLIAENGMVQVAEMSSPRILTPHAGEFDRLFGTSDASKIERTVTAARQSGAVVVHKGADTVIAAPDGRVRVARPGSPWLSTAGTGDVLAGVIGARLAASDDTFAAACEGVWLHGEAASLSGPAFIADALAPRLGAAIARCL
ncbi:NAD(P)H-hydrate dehydratase [Sphingorhabdus soli]|uniref:Bifunctional NAD(P)H-hydrate repair enzyme n=1 Tax=Flavisphingopyxis soli TaxID=2601267 RepID=A0A5C6U7X7_9SPHN|nr:NAD(P)H-hydrate dehydratase [Sphingorhabdus soli]TXC69117.1 NAD(P)H-hydrate dehydratase [Sphingorhabdus soli]